MCHYGNGQGDQSRSGMTRDDWIRVVGGTAFLAGFVLFVVELPAVINWTAAATHDFAYRVGVGLGIALGFLLSGIVPEIVNSLPRGGSDVE